MTGQAKPRLRGSYGIDAPYAPAFMAVMTVVVLVMAIISGQWQTFVPVTFLLAVLGFYLHTTLRGKFLVWAQLLDKVGLRGDERILDLGCSLAARLRRASLGRSNAADLDRPAGLLFLHRPGACPQRRFWAERRTPADLDGTWVVAGLNDVALSGLRFPAHASPAAACFPHYSPLETARIEQKDRGQPKAHS
jgi:hypothetical protein